MLNVVINVFYEGVKAVSGINLEVLKVQNDGRPAPVLNRSAFNIVRHYNENLVSHLIEQGSKTVLNPFQFRKSMALECTYQRILGIVKFASEIGLSDVTINLATHRAIGGRALVAVIEKLSAQDAECEEFHQTINYIGFPKEWFDARNPVTAEDEEVSQPKLEKPKTKVVKTNVDGLKEEKVKQTSKPKTARAKPVVAASESSMQQLVEHFKK